MTRTDFINTVRTFVQGYIDNISAFDSNPQIRINPDSLYITMVNGSDMLSEIDESDTAIENAAWTHGAGNEEASALQVRQNPDFYSVKNLITAANTPDIRAITVLADSYIQN